MGVSFESSGCRIKTSSSSSIHLNAVCSENESDNIHQPSCSKTTPFKSIIDNYIPVKRGFKLASRNINSLSAHIDESGFC